MKKKVWRRTERRHQQQRRGKFQKASQMFFPDLQLHEDKCRYSYKDKPNKQHYNHFKNTTVVRFSALVDLATEISAILPLWRLKRSVYFHLGEYYWKDFSSPDDHQVFLFPVTITPSVSFLKCHDQQRKDQFYSICLHQDVVTLSRFAVKSFDRPWCDLPGLGAAVLLFDSNFTVVWNELWPWARSPP